MLRVLALGDAAWTVEFGSEISPELHARVLGCAAAIAAARAVGEFSDDIECVPAFRSLTVHFDPLATDADELALRLARIASDGTAVAPQGRRLRVPVHFGGDAGPDLAAVAERVGKSAPELIGTLTDQVFTVGLLGFMPGFPYLAGLPKTLHLPRLATPRTRVPARSLAIAGGLLGIYPYVSPGGWHLLGRVPMALFDAHCAAGPTLFQPGDRVVWRAVDDAEFAQIETVPTALAWRACDAEGDTAWPG